ncbi:hypothetical protein PR048_017839 [Dryococelus australis]|uniref:Uncharacterized protein n=1 Tax=Dryococelus australis TaxID=614101 RepID=A0ABQ9HAQ4_9NEOP|nr:hypothetical protein PR048_017839 [Dryococelus australis]
MEVDDKNDFNGSGFSGVEQPGAWKAKQHAARLRGKSSMTTNKKEIPSKFPPHPVSLVTYEFYLNVFLQDFPNVCFKKPRVDTGEKNCDGLNAEMKSKDNVDVTTAKTQQEMHHRKILHLVAKFVRFHVLTKSVSSPQANALEQVLFLAALMLQLRDSYC